MALKKIAGITGDVGHCNCNAEGNCLNISVTCNPEPSPQVCARISF